MSYSMSDLLQLVVSEGASDLHIRVGIPPTIRVHGILHRVEGPPLAPEDSEELMRSITSEEHIQHVRERGGADFGFAFGDVARFRVSVFKEKGNFGMVLRQIPNKLLTMEQIGIPPSAKELLYKPRGLVLVTGPTGSGKTTTLASMINIINQERDEAHIASSRPLVRVSNAGAATTRPISCWMRASWPDRFASLKSSNCAVPWISTDSSVIRRSTNCRSPSMATPSSACTTDRTSSPSSPCEVVHAGHLSPQSRD